MLLTLALAAAVHAQEAEDRTEVWTEQSRRKKMKKIVLMFMLFLIYFCPCLAENKTVYVNDNKIKFCIPDDENIVYGTLFAKEKVVEQENPK